MPTAEDGPEDAPRDTTSAAGALATARIVSWPRRGARRARLEAARRAGRLREVGALDVLAADRLGDLARTSARLLVGAAAGFAALELLTRAARPTPPLLGQSGAGVRLVVLAGANLAAYLVMVPLHEALHALTILTLGGRPRFGVRLPWAAYCTAPNQLFTRRGYTTVALTPLVALTAAGVVVTWLAPSAGAYLWLGFVGNVAGAVGDLAVVRALRALPTELLIADTETGFIAYAVAE
ncbi:MAG: DUF3267 domain-containing protein [Ktedonobacterales bacterium]|nr:DUF3267 domain-containing protein [Ktedonobacterales bacterium]